jgi:hypothetical protein
VAQINLQWVRPSVSQLGYAEFFYPAEVSSRTTVNTPLKDEKFPADEYHLQRGWLLGERKWF